MKNTRVKILKIAIDFSEFMRPTNWHQFLARRHSVRHVFWFVQPFKIRTGRQYNQ
jgi:hypothetical protein